MPAHRGEDRRRLQGHGAAPVPLRHKRLPEGPSPLQPRKQESGWQDEGRVRQPAHQRGGVPAGQDVLDPGRRN